ncbi:hypothetical protein PFDG_05290, partial [Plasmodium falciparum Dd2]
SKTIALINNIHDDFREYKISWLQKIRDTFDSVSSGNDLYVKENKFNNDLMIKNIRYSDFNSDERKNNSCEKM